VSTHKTPATLSVALFSTLFLCLPPAGAEGEPSGHGSALTGHASPPAGEHAEGRTAPRVIEPEDGAVKLTLGTLRDVGLGLAQIKQQALNIFVEATRLPVPLLSGPELPQLTAPPRLSTLRATGYLPPRRQWIFYYIGTMEPLIHNMQGCQDEAEETINRVIIPAGSRGSITPIANEWDKVVATMNGHLTELAGLIENADENNIPIARQAALIYEDVDTLEKMRRRLYRIVQSSERKYPGQTSTLDPGS